MPGIDHSPATPVDAIAKGSVGVALRTTMRRGHQGRTDGNQQAVIDALRDEGASVQSLASVGDGCPDLVVGARGVTYLAEVKDGEKQPSASAC